MIYYQEYNFNASVDRVHCAASKMYYYLVTYICRFNMYPVRKVKIEMYRMFTLKKALIIIQWYKCKLYIVCTEVTCIQLH